MWSNIVYYLKLLSYNSKLERKLFEIPEMLIFLFCNVKSWKKEKKVVHLENLQIRVYNLTNSLGCLSGYINFGLTLPNLT